MKIAVCDDQKEVLEQLDGMLRQIPFVKKVHFYSDLEIFLSIPDEEMDYDAVLMDIDWKSDRTGLDVAEELLRRSPSTKVIYITAYTMEYVEDIFLKLSNLSGFLMKPIKAERLEKNLEKVKDQKACTEGKLVIRSRGSTIAVPFCDIIYLENRLHRVHIILAEKEYQCYERLEQLKKRLNGQFLTCHKSYVVNMEQILEFRNSEIEMTHGTCIPVSKTRYKEARERFFAYLSGRL